MIIGLTGSYASGKDAVAKILEEMNFFHYSLSDFLREELKQRKVTITRDNLINIGNELREKEGYATLAKRALKHVQDGENYVFSSIRNPAEVELLQQREDFVMVNVTAPEKVRLRRIVARNRENDPKTIKELREKEKIENSAHKSGQQLGKVAKMAKVTINNDKDIKTLRKKVEKFVQDWMYKLQDSRPSWDEYFMNIAEVVKSRCNCMSAKKGAIVVKDKKIVSTGYNGTAKGLKHCNQDGCERCKLRHLGKLKSGNYSTVCTCAHAEENALIQAAYNGISTKGATLYTTFTPCHVCARMIINAGIKRVVAKTIYPDDVGTKLLKQAGIQFDILVTEK